MRMFQTIIFAYDGSAKCQDALEEGIVLASRFNARCYLLAIIPPPPVMALADGPLPGEYVEDQQSRAHAILEAGLARLRQAGVEATGILKTDESPVEAIGAVAHETGADLVVVGHHRRSALDRWWRGSVGHSLLDRLPCSLLVSMPGGMAKMADAIRAQHVS
jgi:nucleotide-binding universal stress UspA family protein